MWRVIFLTFKNYKHNEFTIIEISIKYKLISKIYNLDTLKLDIFILIFTQRYFLKLLFI